MEIRVKEKWPGAHNHTPCELGEGGEGVGTHTDYEMSRVEEPVVFFVDVLKSPSYALPSHGTPFSTETIWRLTDRHTDTAYTSRGRTRATELRHKGGGIRCWREGGRTTVHQSSG